MDCCLGVALSLIRLILRILLPGARKQEAAARARHEIRGENQVAKLRGSAMMAYLEESSMQCQRSNPSTWPFAFHGDKKKAVCFLHKVQVCGFCCMDFVLINKLRQDESYLNLLKRRSSDQAARLGMVGSAIQTYQESIQKLSKNPANKQVPFLAKLEQQALLAVEEENDDVSFRKIALVAFHCYQARYVSPEPNGMALELDSAIQEMQETLRFEGDNEIMTQPKKGSCQNKHQHV